MNWRFRILGEENLYMHMNQKGFVNIILIAVVVILIGIAGYFVLTNKSGSVPKIPFQKTGTINIKLLDAFSGQAISNADVRIYSDNGILCFTTPCNTEGQEWTGKSDNGGIISIPSKVINVVTTITATGYKSGRDLNKDSEKIDNNNWLIELDPDSKIDHFERRLKLIDSQTQKPLSNTAVWITNNQNCRPPECSDYSFTGITNSQGNIYYRISSVKDNSWVFVNSYKVVKFPTGWVNFKVILEKE